MSDSRNEISICSGKKNEDVRCNIDEWGEMNTQITYLGVNNE